MRSGRPRRDLGWLRGWSTGRTLVACLAAGAAGLALLAWTVRASRTAAPRSDAARPASADAVATSPLERVCGNDTILGGGPSSPPKGAVAIPAGDNSESVLAHNWTMKPQTTYWFAPGVHTLGKGQFSQIIPAKGDTFVGAPGAVLDGQHANLYAFTQTASNVTVRYLTIQNFGAPGGNNGQGVVNNGMASGWKIDHVTVQNNAGAAVVVGPGTVLADSCLKDNGEYGFQGGGSNILVVHNEVVGNNTDDWEARRPGCGCAGGGKFWGANRATVTDNLVHDNHGPGLWADTNNFGFDVERNYFADNQGVGFIYETSYNLRLAHNTFVRNALGAGPKLGGFPDSAVYISESGADSRVPGPFGETLAITQNIFIDNWGGVVLWENAERYCGSPANTSTNECTLVNPRVATTGSCNPTSVLGEPYYNDCRWKTQNVLVTGNTFSFDPARIGPECTPSNYCGFNGVFSQWGSWPSYHGTVVGTHVTFDQNNHFVSNRYVGPWSFVVYQQGNVVGWDGWRESPYGQDSGSTMSGR